MSSNRSDRDRKLDEFARRYRERLAREWPEGETDVTRIEEIVARVERETTRELTEEMIREQTGKRQGNRSACACGGTATYRKQSTVTLVTAFGRVRAERAYFYCQQCRDGHCPQDREWGIGPGHTTPTVQSLVGYLAATGAYVQVPGTLSRARPSIHLGVKTVELIAQRLGERVRETPPRVAGPAKGTLAVAVDGVMLPTRAGYREARCGVVYEPDWQANRTPGGKAGLGKEFFGTLGSREALMRAVCACVAQRRLIPDTPVAALGDGADWIWENYARFLPNRVEILDFQHVGNHLAEVTAAWHPNDPQAAEGLRERLKQSLLERGPGPLLCVLRQWEPKGHFAQEVKRLQSGYFERNRGRMDYPAYLRAGFPIGSGAVEGACKHLVSDRFKGSGMRWNSATAEPLLQLRAALLTRPDLDLRPYAGARMAA